MATAAVVSVSMGVMKPVLDKLATLMGDEYKKIKGLCKKVTSLQRELRDMDALLEKMDGADELDPQAKNWRKDIIEMSYNIEDCIDDFMQRLGQTNNKVGILRKAFKNLRTLKDRYHLGNQLEEIKAQVMEASERRKRYMLDESISITAPVVVDPRLSAIYKESASHVGIEAQKTELVNWAMDKGQELKVMAIVGLGGLGKTTLANEVYREVEGKFDYKAFVSVSQKPDMPGLFNSLLKQLGLRPYDHACQVHDPINDLRRHLQDKRYFIVVDDLWGIQAWNAIRCAFPQNSQHSRVVITTRLEDVARACCGNNGFIHTMKPLSEADSRKLFFDRIFGSENDCPLELTEVSCGILKKCGGLPLAIITMASMLACQPTRLESHWECILNSLATNFAANSYYEDMMYVLDLSYKNLPRQLKACFLYLGSYPEDREIYRGELVRRWVAEGFVSSCAGQNVWDVAESYFNELVNRSMIQPTYYNHVFGISGCRVHDMLLELIEKRCKEDNFLSLLNDEQAVVQVQVKVIRRLNIVGLRATKDGKVCVTTAVNLARIRSLTVLQQSRWNPSLLEFKFLRVLSIDFRYSSLKFEKLDLTVINQLSQLRYLMIRELSQNVMLPCQIKGLLLLETLDLSGLSDRIPLELADVPGLSHLLVPRYTMLPDYIGKMRLLRTLHGFSLPVDSLESIRGLGELTDLSYLHLRFSDSHAAGLPTAIWMTALSTSLDKLSNLKQLRLYPAECLHEDVALRADVLNTLSLPTAIWMTALSTSLDKLSNIKQLRLYPAKCLHEDVALRADVLSTLSPPFRSLELLHLQFACTFSRVPRWIGHLGNLQELRIGVMQILQEDVAIIGTRLGSLVKLCLRIKSALTERIVIGGSMGFPLVKMFELACDGISHLTFETGAMPELRDLILAFATEEWDNATPGGLHHLLSLETISTFPKVRDMADKAELVRGVFEDAAAALPTRPIFVSRPGSWIRPIEEEEEAGHAHHGGGGGSS